MRINFKQKELIEKYVIALKEKFRPVQLNITV